MTMHVLVTQTILHVRLSHYTAGVYTSHHDQTAADSCVSNGVLPKHHHRYANACITLTSYMNGGLYPGYVHSMVHASYMIN